MERFVMFPSPVLKRSSNLCGASWPWHDEQRSMCMIFGSPKEDFKSVSASWAGSRLSLRMALSRSADQALLSAGPSVSGAPKRVAFFFDVIRKSRKAVSAVVGQRWMSSHFLALRCKHRVLPSVLGHYVRLAAKRYVIHVSVDKVIIIIIIILSLFLLL